MKPFLGLLLLFTSGVYAQSHSVSDPFAQVIQRNSIREHVYQLASPEFQGREAGKEGNRKAAEYIAGLLASYGIPPLPDNGTYFQKVAFSTITWDKIELTVSGEKYKHLEDFLSVPQFFPEGPQPIDIQSMTFIGYGIDDPAYSDYKGIDVKGKHLLVFGGEPRKPNGKYIISGSDTASRWSIDPLFKMEAAKKAGAASIWIIESDLQGMVSNAKKYLLTGAMLMGSPEQLAEGYLPHAAISTELGQKLTGKKTKKINALRNRIAKKGKPGHLTFPVDIHWNAVHDIYSIKGVNVLGYIEGSDPVKKNEVVVVSAHYDHLGIRGKEIFPGADDNASGTSAVIELAHAFSKAKAAGQGPKRSVLCMLVTGEEKGLLGSQYYAEYPVFPLEKTVADINIDMIGRIDEAHTDSNYVYIIGSDRLSTELHQINEAANKQHTHLQLDYTFNKDDDPNRFYYRSDHYNFAKNGIPSVFFFSGVHADYHRPTDTPDKLMYGKAETIARLAFYTAWELANRDQRIKVDVFGRN